MTVVLSARLVVAGIAVLALAGCGKADPGEVAVPAATGAVTTTDPQAAVRLRKEAAERQAAIEAAATTTAAGTTAAPTPTPPTPPVAAPTRPRPLLSVADRKSFAQLARTLPGQEGIVLVPLSGDAGLAQVGALRTGVAWSTAKVPVAMAAISGGVAKDSDLVPAITASDNAAAERLWSALGEGEPAAQAADARLRSAGDPRTEVQPARLRAGYTAFGQTEWRLADQARFAARMGCEASGEKVLRLMGQVVGGQRWGLGSTGSPARFKGGWGPGVSPGSAGGWLDRQFGIVTVRGKPIAMAIASTAPDHGSGTMALTSLATWAVQHMDVSAARRGRGC